VKNLLAGAILAISALLPACTTVQEQTVVIQHADQIERFDTLRNATVMLEMSKDGQKVGSCSAVAIKPHILLTAAHCDAGSINVKGVGKAVKIRKDEGVDLMFLYVENLKADVVAVSGVTPIMDTKVVTVGYPLGVGQFLTEGRIQAELILDDVPEEYLTKVKGYVAISSPVVFGNSGGPVFAKINGEYKVIGIMSAMAVAGFGSPITHLAFAVNAETINKFLEGK
jgi:S1-C subfamily serine protease